MGRVLSIDLAYKKTSDFGVCLIEESSGRTTGVSFPSPEDVGLEDPPDASQCAQAIWDYCARQDIHLALLDGPQGWKAPESQLVQRYCEKLLATQGKVGLEGHTKPRSFVGFATFSIRLFACLCDRGARLVRQPRLEAAGQGLLAVESFPTSAWKKLALTPLPGKRVKRDLRRERIRELLRELQALFSFQVPSLPKEDGLPSHDQLQALVAGFAGVAILAELETGYCATGWPPQVHGETVVEGFIVNPLRPVFR